MGQSIRQAEHHFTGRGDGDPRFFIVHYIGHVFSFQ
jgi:hypothetical protein